MSNGIEGFTTLEVDLEQALVEELIHTFDDGLSSIGLSTKNLSRVPDGQGVYQLFHDGELVYIGKTDADTGLHGRLERHRKKVLHRMNLDPEDMTFRAVRVYVFTPMDLERLLKKHYMQANGGTKLRWDYSGFGANDPGRKRDTSTVKKTHFDVLYPVDVDRTITLPNHARQSVAELLGHLKQAVPYLVRYQKQPGSKRKPHSDLVAANATLPGAKTTARNVLKVVAGSLSPEWQITIQQGYVIIYKENRAYDRPQAVFRGS